MSSNAARLSLPSLRAASRARPAPAWPAPAAESGRLSLEALLAPDRWAPIQADPELRKVIAFVQAQVGEARRLLAAPADALTLRTDGALRELKVLLHQDPAALTIDSAWELAGALKRLNLRLGNGGQVASLLEYECNRSQAAGRWHGWDVHFDRSELVKLVRAYHAGRVTPAQHADAVDRLTFLYLMRAEAGRNRRARAALKCLYLNRLMPVLFTLLVALGIAIRFASGGARWDSIALTAVAGAVGSTLSGVFKVRDQLVRLEELRAFAPAMRVQPLVGACAGVITLLLLESNAVSVGALSRDAWSTLALLAFAAGFSEPFFLGTVQRVADLAEGKADEHKPSK
jgi:hypothetical protein